MKRRLQRPSIEASLSRKHQHVGAHPVAKRLSAFPVLGRVAAAWIQATQNGEPVRRWASLPPFASA